MAGGWAPTLRVHETGNGCRLVLVGVTYGNGATLQEAADDLVTRLLNILMTLRSTGLRFPGGMAPPHQGLMAYLWDLGEVAHRGGDIRDHLFGSPNTHDTAA
jgi:hypothetical protein